MNWTDEVERMLSELEKNRIDISKYGLIVSPSMWEKMGRPKEYRSALGVTIEVGVSMVMSEEKHAILFHETRLEKEMLDE